MPFSLNKFLQCTVTEDNLSDGEDMGQVKVPDIMYVAIYYTLDSKPTLDISRRISRQSKRGSVEGDDFVGHEAWAPAGRLLSASNSHRSSLYTRHLQCLTNKSIHLQLQSLRDRANRLISMCTHSYLTWIEGWMLTISVQVGNHPQRRVRGNV